MTAPSPGPVSPESIARIRLFDGIPSASIAPILARCPLRSLQAGEVLIEAGRHNRELFLLLSGQLRAYLQAADSPGGFEIHAGESAGEISVIDGRPTTAFVMADLPSTVVVVSDTCLWEELATLPGLTRNLMRLVSERMRAGIGEMFAAHQNRLRIEELERELANAREIQAHMLPHREPLLAGFDRLDVRALMEPAREVGGDFYDAFALGPRHACVVVGDVSGKSMPAAMFMVRALTLLRAEARAGADIEGIVTRLNEALAEDNPSCMFVTLCLVVVEHDSGEATVVCAGHDPPIARLSGRSWQFLPKPAGPLVGVIEGATFATHRVKLQPADVVVLYTDGVTEAEDARRAPYTAARLREDLERASSADPAAIVDGIRQDVAVHTAGHPASDDITILALRYG